MNSILTVSAVNTYISFKLKNDPKLKGIAVSGEISDISINQASGHIYFTITDGKSSLRAVMFSSNAARLRFFPEIGQSVVAFGGIEVYERSGIYQIVCTQLIPSGKGAEYVALMRLRDELEREGVFAKEKQLIPKYPELIAVVTSPSGAAVHDIMSVVARRYPLTKVLLFGAQVQGVSAPASIAAALESADESGADVIILTRGGGSGEDLSCFNTKAPVMAVYNCKTPVVSAVGHEIDYTLCDLAADLRAPTPSAAAEMCTPSIDEIYSIIYDLKTKISSSARLKIDSMSYDVKNCVSLFNAYSPERRIKSLTYEMKALREMIFNYAYSKVSMVEREVVGCKSLLQQSDPMKIASRGYALIYKNGEIVTSAAGMSGTVEIKMKDGVVSAEVIDVRKEGSAK